MAGIEEKLDALTEALKANTAAVLKASGGTAAAATGTSNAGKGGGKGGSKAAESKVNQDQMNAALIKLKDKFGMDESKAIIKEHGKCDKMAEIKPANYEAVYTAAVARYEELETGGTGSDDDGL